MRLSEFLRKYPDLINTNIDDLFKISAKFVKGELVHEMIFELNVPEDVKTDLRKVYKL